MPALANSVAELGVGDLDGQVKVIKYGNERQSMYWNETAGVWISRARPTIRMKRDTLMGVQPDIAEWQYVNQSKPIVGTIGRSGYGWTPQAIHRADLAYAAGLKMQEKIDYIFWVWTAADDLRISTVFFDLDIGDVISTLISATAGDHIGTTITGDLGARIGRSTGWVDSQIPAPDKAVLAPHIYVKQFSGGALSGPPTLEFFDASWRWIGDPTPPGGMTTTAAASSVTIPAPSSSAGNITFSFDTNYEVGQFVNGDYFVLPHTPTGAVQVTSITPAYSSGRHGYAVNPVATSWNAPQRFDDRGDENAPFTAPASLPLNLSGGQSLVKVASLPTQTSYSWIRHAAVLTCLSAPPPVGSLRPSAYGTDKTLFSLKPGLSVPNLTASAVADRLNLADALDRCQLFRNDYHPDPSWGYYRASSDSVLDGKTWGGDVLKADVELLCSICLNHLSSGEKTQILAAYVQHGIDTWGIAHNGGAGFLRGGGGNGAAHLLQLSVAAWATDHSTLKSYLSNAPTDWQDADLCFWETASYYRGNNGAALWGKKFEDFDSEAQYWSELNSIPNGHLRDPYFLIDGGPIPGDSYQGITAHQMVGIAALFDTIPALKAVWPTLVDNADVVHEYGHRWASHGAKTLPDPVAPKSGSYGVTYGHNPSPPPSYIAGSGRLAFLDGNKQDNRFSQLTEDFYVAYATADPAILLADTTLESDTVLLA